MTSALEALADKNHLPMLKMSEENVDRFIAQASPEALNRFSLQKDKQGGNLYQFADEKLLEKLFIN